MVLPYSFYLQKKATWPPPNYTNPVSRGPALVTTNFLFLGFTFFIVGLRVYTRLRISRYFGADDILISLALIPCAAMNGVLLIQGVKYGFDHHIWDVSLDNLTSGRFLSLVEEVTFAMSAGLTKVSALLFIWRLRGLPRDWPCLLGLFLCSIQTVAFCFLATFQCQPMKGYWDFSVLNPKCLNEFVILTVFSVLNTFTDFLTVILPISVFWRMKMPPRQRVLVCTLFGLGIFASAAGIIRVVYSIIVGGDLDFTWQAYPIWLVNSIELNLGIICTSGPSLKPLLCHYFPSMFDGISPTTSLEASLND